MRRSRQGRGNGQEIQRTSPGSSRGIGTGSGDRSSLNTQNSCDSWYLWTYSIPILSAALGFIQILLYLLSERLGVHSEEDVGVSWNKVVIQKGYWRLFVAHFFHFGRLHVFLNVVSLYCFGRFLERKMQWFSLLLILEAMGIGSNLLFILSNRYITGASIDTSACGFSHVHFGLRILLAYTQEPRNYEPSLFLGLYPAYLSPLWAPWQPLLEVSLLKIIITELNVTGHFSGILMGFLISFLLRLFPPQLIYTQQFVNARNWRR